MKLSERIVKDIKRQGYADTKKYRYQIFAYADREEIRRIELSALDTTAALDGWKTITTTKRAED